MRGGRECGEGLGKLQAVAALSSRMRMRTAHLPQLQHGSFPPSHTSSLQTGIPWLIERFKQYVVLRERLFSDTSVLRGKLHESIPGAKLGLLQRRRAAVLGRRGAAGGRGSAVTALFGGAGG